jgi:hypothetical protein
MLIIGVGSKARQGKDTFCNAVVDHYENQRQTAKRHDRISLAPVAQNFKFAGVLYEVCQELYGMKEKDGELMQRVGTECREKNPNHWIEKCFKKIDTSAVQIALISDVRYKNEADFIKSRDGILVNVVRLNPDGSQFITGDRPADHPSEIELDGYNWDYRISAPSGQAGLIAELAITLTEYIRALDQSLKQVAWG